MAPRELSGIGPEPLTAGSCLGKISEVSRRQGMTEDKRKIRMKPPAQHRGDEGLVKNPRPDATHIAKKKTLVRPHPLDLPGAEEDTIHMQVARDVSHDEFHSMHCEQPGEPGSIEGVKDQQTARF